MAAAAYSVHGDNVYMLNVLSAATATRIALLD